MCIFFRHSANMLATLTESLVASSFSSLRTNLFPGTFCLSCEHFELEPKGPSVSFIQTGRHGMPRVLSLGPYSSIDSSAHNIVQGTISWVIGLLRLSAQLPFQPYQIDCFGSKTKSIVFDRPFRACEIYRLGDRLSDLITPLIDSGFAVQCY